MISYLFLLVAGAFEMLAVVVMSAFARGGSFGRKCALIALLALNLALSLGALTLAMREISLPVAYAIWTGIGTIGAVFVGIYLNHDRLGAQKILGLILIISSAIMLKLI